MKSPGLHWISPSDPPDAFPDIDRALAEPAGLLAAGGDLSEERLIHAYRHGIFPWFDEGQPILWWSPDPRCVLEPAAFHVSRRLRRNLRGAGFHVTFNRSFESVVQGCAAPRPAQHGTWITPDMALAYGRLHRHGWAHSIEVRVDGALVGGLYGIAIGRVFFGESMYSDADDASKAALLSLCRILDAHAFALVDCQVVSQHLLTLGATLMPRTRFRRTLDGACEPATAFDAWPENALDVAELLA